MEQDNLLNYLYTMLKNQHLWFVSKTDNTGIYWQTKPKKYYTLDEYGEIKDKKKIEKEINDYLGDGAETISEAVALFIADGVCDGSISQIDYLNMNFKDKPVEYSENAIEVKNIEPKYIEPQITGSNKQVESKQLNKTYYNELPNKTGKDLSDFKSMLDTLNNNGKQSRRGKWNIGNGGYDLWYEIYYNDLPVIQCINGKVNNITDKEVFEFYTKLFADICNYEYDEETIESKKQEDIFDDVTNGEAVYGVYDDKDDRNLKDRYKEPTYAKRNKIRNFKDDKFTQRSVRDIINKDVTHVDYEKMPNERVQAYKNSKKEENVQRRLEEENNKSLNLISDMFKSKDFDSDSKAGQIVMRTSNLFNVLSDKGYDVQVSFDNGESTSTILLGQQGGSILITITDTNQPLRAFTNGSFEITEDNVKTLEDIRKEIIII